MISVAIAIKYSASPVEPARNAY